MREELSLSTRIDYCLIHRKSHFIWWLLCIPHTHSLKPITLSFYREYLFIMRYKLCSSFPLAEILRFHKTKERELDALQEKLLEEDLHNPLVKENLALVTVMGARVETEKNRNYGCFAIDENTQEMLHYAENTGDGTTGSGGYHISNLVNYGIYLFSVRLYTEYGLNPYPDDDDEHGSPGNGSGNNFFGGCDTP